MKKRILILDTYSPSPYDPLILETNTHGTGGTEAVVTKIAEELGKTHHIVLAQAARKKIVQFNALYSPIFPHFLTEKWDHIIAIRDSNLALYIRTFYPVTPIWLWLHDLIDTHYHLNFKKNFDKNIKLITISAFQSKLVKNLVKLDPYATYSLDIHQIPNPIDDNIVPENTPIDLNKLVYCSAPNRGLEDTLKIFAKAKKINKNFELYLSCPGYKKLESSSQEGVKVLGSLSHKENIKNMRNALCLFYMNNIFPEPFGLVFAEANAIGTPVLTHDFGGAKEILSNKEQLINTHDEQSVLERLMLWHNGARPKVYLDEKFRFSNVIKLWYTLLEV